MGPGQSETFDAAAATTINTHHVNFRAPLNRFGSELAYVKGSRRPALAVGAAWGASAPVPATYKRQGYRTVPPNHNHKENPRRVAFCGSIRTTEHWRQFCGRDGSAKLSTAQEAADACAHGSLRQSEGASPCGCEVPVDGAFARRRCEQCDDRAPVENTMAPQPSGYRSGAAVPMCRG